MDQPDLLRHTIGTLDRLGLSYMVVGSLASSAYGEPRYTQDIDIVVTLQVDDVGPFCEMFPAPDYYVSPDAAMQAARSGGQFNVIHPASGNKIDFMIARDDPWGRMQMSRRRRVLLLPDLEGYTASAEDIILSKMAYYREGGSEKHLRDITGILKVNDVQVDRAYVAQWAETLGLTEIWQVVCRRLEATDEDRP